MFLLRTDARLHPLDVVAQHVDVIAWVQSLAVPRVSHGHLPSDAFASAPRGDGAVARVGEHVPLLAVQQLI